MPLKNFALTRVQSFPFGESEQKGKGQHPAQQRRDSDSLPLYLAEVQGPVLEQDTPSFKTPSELAVLYTTVQIRSSNHNQPVGIFNHSSWILNDTQLKPLLALDESDWEKVTNQPSAVQKLSVPSFTMGDAKEKWMELVVNNMDDKGHPFHMVRTLSLSRVEIGLMHHSTDTSFMLFYRDRLSWVSMVRTTPSTQSRNIPRIPLCHLRPLSRTRFMFQQWDMSS